MIEQMIELVLQAEELEDQRERGYTLSEEMLEPATELGAGWRYC